MGKRKPKMKCIPQFFNIVGLVVFLVVITGCANSKMRGSPNFSSINGGQSQNGSVTTNKRSVSRPDIKPVIKTKYQKGLDLLKKGKLDKAATVFKLILKQHPDISGPYINLGIIHLKKEEWGKAEKMFLMAESYGINNPELFNYLGITYRQQGKFKEAETAYKRSISINPSFAKAYLNLGILFDLYLSNLLQAKHYYEKFQELSPGNTKVKSWLLDLDTRIQASTE